jgi:hypothetical protein
VCVVPLGEKQWAIASHALIGSANRGVRMEANLIERRVILLIAKHKPRVELPVEPCQGNTSSSNFSLVVPEKFMTVDGGSS